MGHFLGTHFGTLFIIFDILEPSALQKYSICWVFQLLCICLSPTLLMLKIPVRLILAIGQHLEMTFGCISSLDWSTGLTWHRERLQWQKQVQDPLYQMCLWNISNHDNPVSQTKTSSFSFWPKSNIYVKGKMCLHLNGASAARSASSPIIKYHWKSRWQNPMLVAGFIRWWTHPADIHRVCSFADNIRVWLDLLCNLEWIKPWSRTRSHWAKETQPNFIPWLKCSNIVLVQPICNL